MPEKKYYSLISSLTDCHYIFEIVTYSGLCGRIIAAQPSRQLPNKLQGGLNLDMEVKSH